MEKGIGETNHESQTPNRQNEVNPQRWRVFGRSKVGLHVSGDQLTHMGCLELSGRQIA